MNILGHFLDISLTSSRIPWYRRKIFYTCRIIGELWCFFHRSFWRFGVVFDALLPIACRLAVLLIYFIGKKPYSLHLYKALMNFSPFCRIYSEATTKEERMKGKNQHCLSSSHVEENKYENDISSSRRLAPPCQNWSSTGSYLIDLHSMSNNLWTIRCTRFFWRITLHTANIYIGL